MAWRFEQADTTGDGWTLKAWKGSLPVGRILRGRDGVYRFYTGLGGDGAGLLQKPLVENRDLEILKQWLQQNI